MLVDQVRNIFSYNPYSGNNTTQPAATASMPNAAVYGADTAFFDTTRPASGDGAITKMLVGGYTGFSYAKSGSGQPLTQFMLSSVGIGAAISGSVSVVKNLASLTHGKQSASSTVGNILTDTLQGGVSAIGGVAVGGGAMAIFKAMGAAPGNPLIIAGVVGGALGAVLANKILNTEAIRRSLT
ncbi:hypothetical protein COW36_07710 [bacterium (Candidatus Blackallbacteria) CG17_big_fil_post_rev_8_21_14_2_50_48_46]|uniref:Uncharacterized protein n=1 Tax=bacterium (Candidatus Blackallbacteria) CG17_big_fil_post_rev_8_21_14_2_50_48_46 TaxID=2014261 RepID=A0A2M7G6Q9_9BACT|nr:MAG: hypothetical protein COW64_06415 [bacterium (Candidatus Blackallbacteria) CG18_big_fil_WC_8_21_14_2_50_49_26]PIW17725.1 MAG: hypothetical protein COW36_07710 [bacterium (Candidatus Blackallbacteria) CG17_big_fil_post_rev_8_21_14_2_50_48_46]PIW47541.1 MAG: hypothetical protein COW20_12455 [bacterium (Candidatus Blackallbacteria) CG13_big_fil_rev_8_21_14_2_50_49_14]